MSSGGGNAAGLALTGAQMSGQIGSGFARGEEIRAETNFITSQLTLKEELLKRQAGDVINRGIDQRVRIQEALKQELSSTRAAKGNSGTLIGSGSNADVEKSKIDVATLDELEVMADARRQAWALEFEASEVAGQREMAALAGKTARRNSIISGGLQALGTGAQGYSKYGDALGGGGGGVEDPSYDPQKQKGDSLFPASSNPRRAGGSLDNPHLKRSRSLRKVQYRRRGNRTITNY